MRSASLEIQDFSEEELLQLKSYIDYLRFLRTRPCPEEENG